MKITGLLCRWRGLCPWILRMFLDCHDFPKREPCEPCDPFTATPGPTWRNPLHATAGDHRKSCQRLSQWAIDIIDGVVLKGIFAQDAMPFLSRQCKKLIETDQQSSQNHKPVKVSEALDQSWRLGPQIRQDSYAKTCQDTLPLNLLGAQRSAVLRIVRPWRDIRSRSTMRESVQPLFGTRAPKLLRWQ
jgi:hypothetical protein